MRNLAMSCAVAALVALSAQTEARPRVSAEAQVPTVIPVKQVIGVASWYGPECHGNPTANGEVFDMYGLTAAHRDMPFGTRIRVTNLRNRRSLVLRVNDRGPGVPGRVLDVSMAAAWYLGFIGAGLAPVQIEVLPCREARDSSHAARFTSVPMIIPAKATRSELPAGAASRGE